MGKKILLLSPTLVGMGLIISAVISGIMPLMYAGIAVLFGGNFLMAIIAVIIAFRGSARDNKEKRRESGIGAKGRLIACGVIAAVIGPPFIGMTLMSMDLILPGVLVFLCGPAAVAIMIIVSKIREKKSRMSEDSDGNIVAVTDKKYGVVVMCMALSSMSDDDKYLVRVDCDGKMYTARSQLPYNEGERVKVVFYDSGRIEAVMSVEFDAKSSKNRKKSAEIEEVYTHDETTKSDDDSVTPMPEKTEAKPHRSVVTAPDITPNIGDDVYANDCDTEMPESDAPMIANETPTEQVDTDSARPQHSHKPARPTVGYKGIKKK